MGTKHGTSILGFEPELKNVRGADEVRRYGMLGRYAVPKLKDMQESLDSPYEKEILEYISTLVNQQDIVLMEKRELFPCSLHIFIKPLNLAFEVIDLFWARKGILTENYYQQKSIMLAKKGIRLFCIFSDTWLNQRDNVKFMIKNTIHKFQYYSFCIKPISKYSYSNFTNGYGFNESKFENDYGIFYDNILRSVYSFNATEKNTICQILSSVDMLNFSVITGYLKNIHSLNSFKYEIPCLYGNRLKLPTLEYYSPTDFYVYEVDDSNSVITYKSTIDLVNNNMKSYIVQDLGTLRFNV